MSSLFSPQPLFTLFFSPRQLSDSRLILKKSSSCSTIFIDDSTVSHPNLKNTIKCVTLAIYYHIRNRITNRVFDIFDERLHPLSVSDALSNSSWPDMPYSC